MYYLLHLQRLPFLFRLILLTCLIAFCAQAPALSVHAQGKSPLRLRLKVERNALRSGETTKVFAEFLNRDYQQVANDGSRIVEFSVASSGSAQAGSGNFSPQRVRVGSGELSAAATFVSRQPGKLFIRASSDGLDAAQTLVVVMQQRASLFSRLFETVAYAESQNEIEISPKTGDFPPAPANGKTQVDFQLSFTAMPSEGASVRIRTTLKSGGLIYQGQNIGCAIADIKLDKIISDPISIFSATPGTTKIFARVLPNGPEAEVEINFEAPKPAKIILDVDPQSIPFYQQAVPVSVQLADEGGFPIPLGTDREWKVELTTAADSSLMEFEPKSLVLARDRPSAQSILRFKQSPKTSEIKLLAVDAQNHSLATGQKIITIQSPLVTASYWLLLAAVLGGAVGGLARLLHKAERLACIVPTRIGNDLDLGLIGRISGSIISGLFLYWTIKLGLARVTLDLGTPTVACFFGGIGGFAGLVVLDRLVEWCFNLLHWTLPWEKKGAVAPGALATQTAATGSASMETR